VASKITLPDLRMSSTTIHLLAEAETDAKKTVTGKPETSM
jgi:hypothetical protein